MKKILLSFCFVTLWFLSLAAKQNFIHQTESSSNPLRHFKETSSEISDKLYVKFYQKR